MGVRQAFERMIGGVWVTNSVWMREPFIAFRRPLRALRLLLAIVKSSLYIAPPGSALYTFNEDGLIWFIAIVCGDPYGEDTIRVGKVFFDDKNFWKTMLEDDRLTDADKLRRSMEIAAGEPVTIYGAYDR